MFEYRKYGNGSSVYEVFLLVGFDTLSRVKRYATIGFVEKSGRDWVAMDGVNISGKTRKEVAEKLQKIYLEK